MAEESKAIKSGFSAKEHLDVSNTILHYEAFINDKLKQDLKKVIAQRDEIYSNIAEYLQLKRSIEQMEIMRERYGTKKSAKVMTDLGCNFYCQAEITDTSKVLILVGFGFYVEFTPKEGLEFITKKVITLTKRAEKLTLEAAKIKALIKLILNGLRDLQQLDFSDNVQQRENVV